MADEQEELAMAPEDELNEGEEAEAEAEEGSVAGSQHHLSKFAPAIISIHPSSSFVVVSVGARFRVFDLEKNEAVTPVDNTTSPSGHRSAIRAARFNHTGSCFVSTGDDKLVKLWDVSSWKCLRTITVNKKLSAVTFSKDGEWLLVADKFGVVYVTPTSGQEKCEEPAQLLAHCCSIITSLEISPCGKFVVTADRDFKIRVSVFPAKPELGAYEIQSFCLGHTSFVSCLAFVTGSSDEGLLVSGGGDSTIRLWDYVAGTMLDVLEIDEDMKLKGEGAVVNLAVTGATIAATVERFAGVLLLSCDTATRKLSLVQKIMHHELICPTGLQFENREKRLWLIAGGAETRDVGDRALTPGQVEEATAQAQAASSAALTRLQILQRFDPGSRDEEYDYKTLDDDSVPGSSGLLDALQGQTRDSSVSIARAVAEAAEAAELAMKQLLSKRQYSEAQRELRKRSRNDKKAST